MSVDSKRNTIANMVLTTEKRADMTALGKYEGIYSKEDQNANTTPILSTYLKVVFEDKNAIVKTTRIDGPKGVFIINEKAFSCSIKSAPLIIQEISTWRYVRHKACHDDKTKSMLLGVVIAAIGVGIDAGIAVGKIDGVWAVALPAWAIGGLTVLSFFLKGLGLFITFYQGAKEKL
jgi:hypothetical protein